MYKKLPTLTLALFLSMTIGAQSSDFYDYIDRFKKIAIKEMERTGVPASIKLSQAILESNAGKSLLAKDANNHFGIKCGGDWDGKTYHIEDDDFDEFGNIQKSCFRKFKNADESFVAHSDFLRDPKKANRYGFLFQLKKDDYKRWARGLKTSGYATGANYDDKLIRIIETYELYKYDKMSDDNFRDNVPEKPGDLIAGLDIRLVNDVKVVFAKNHITVQDISLKTGVSESRLKKYNEQLPALSDSLANDTRVFLQPKRCRNRGKQKWHYIAAGQTLFDVSQQYGVKLSQIYKRNRLPEGAELQTNEKVKLKGWKIKESERPRLSNEKKPTTTVPVLLDDDEDFDGDFMDEDITPQNPNPPTTNPPKPNPPKPSTGNPPTTTTPPTTTNPPPSSSVVYHTVIKGDTLYNISKRYDTTVDILMRLNNMTNTNISLGQSLRVK